MTVLLYYAEQAVEGGGIPLILKKSPFKMECPREDFEINIMY